MNSIPRLAIVDWGIGGISIRQQLAGRMPDVSVLYLSDTGATPYGKFTRQDLVSRLNQVIGFLVRRGVTHVVFGCNAASTVVDELQTNGMRVEGVIKCAITLLGRLQPARLGLIGGRRTVLSGVYRRRLYEMGISVSQRVAQPLSARIEGGDISSDELRQDCLRILSPIRNSSHLLLACTHYPAITQMIREIVSENTTIVDPAGELVDLVARWNLGHGGRDVYLTTGDAAGMVRAAKNAFGFVIPKAERVTIES